MSYDKLETPPEHASSAKRDKSAMAERDSKTRRVFGKSKIGEGKSAMSKGYNPHVDHETIPSGHSHLKQHGAMSGVKTTAALAGGGTRGAASADRHGGEHDEGHGVKGQGKHDSPKNKRTGGAHEGSEY